MALKVDSEFCGIQVSGAYCTVGSLGFSGDKSKVIFALYRRASKENEPFDSHPFTAPYDIEGSDPFAQAYEYLKTRPEFESATDC